MCSCKLFLCRMKTPSFLSLRHALEFILHRQKLLNSSHLTVYVINVTILCNPPWGSNPRPHSTICLSQHPIPYALCPSQSTKKAQAIIQWWIIIILTMHFTASSQRTEGEDVSTELECCHSRAHPIILNFNRVHASSNQSLLTVQWLDSVYETKCSAGAWFITNARL